MRCSALWLSLVRAIVRRGEVITRLAVLGRGQSIGGVVV